MRRPNGPENHSTAGMSEHAQIVSSASWNVSNLSEGVALATEVMYQSSVCFDCYYIAEMFNVSYQDVSRKQDEYEKYT